MQQNLATGLQPRQSDLDHIRWLQDAGIKSFKNLRILDLGCGSGYFCHHAMADGASLSVGIDMVRPDIPASGTNGWHFSHLNLDLPDWQKEFTNRFDLVVAYDVIEHLRAPFAFLQSIREVMAPNGTLVLTTPNALSWERYRNPGGWSGVADTQHKLLFTKYTLSVLLERTGFAVKSMKAPLRALAYLGPMQPQVGGQIICFASAKSGTESK